MPFVLYFVIGLVLLILLAAGGFVFAANMESQDPFCSSCHSQPESTFVQRSAATQPVDLASYHTTQHMLCIDCHSGPGISGRLQAEIIGARNTIKWFTGTAVQPAVVSFPIRDQNCLKCYRAVAQKGFRPMQQFLVLESALGGPQGDGAKNHWHEQLARWQTASPQAGTCISCHSGHYDGTDSQSGFSNAQVVQSVCNACHQVLGKGKNN